MGSTWREFLAGAALVLAVTAVTAESAAPSACSAGAAAGKPHRPAPRHPAPANPVAPVCGDMVTSVALTLAPTGPVAAPASAPSAAAKSKVATERQPSPSALERIERGAVTAAGVSLLLLLTGLAVGMLRGGFGLGGHAGSFGGRGWSWEATPALTLLVCAAVVMGLSLLLTWQVLQFDGRPATDAAAAAASAARG